MVSSYWEFNVGNPDQFLIGINIFQGEDEQGQLFQAYSIGFLFFDITYYKILNDEINE
jgi:hypothetical protein